MTQADIINQLLLLTPIAHDYHNNIHNAFILFLGGACAFLFAYLLTFAVRAFCYKMGWLDYPAERRVHSKAVPRLGGVAMFVAFVLASFLLYTPGSQNERVIYWLLLAASGLMVLVHAYDDILGLKPWPKLLAQTLAVLIVLGPWDGVFHGILLFTINNPFGRPVMEPGLPWYLQPTLFLFIHPPSPSPNFLPNITFLAIPAVLLTWFWVAGMMNTVNWIDGMDGLATGVVGIAGLFVTLISFMLDQQSIAVLAAIFTGAVFGFLPHNWNPARIFMGDTGSMFLGLGLAVLSVMGGAKLALALMVLGVPILDVAVVIINRIRRGQSPLHYDKTHLHHRLMATGLSVKQICYMIYGLSLLFGLLALTLTGMHNAHFYKFIGLGLVGVTMVALIIWMDYRQRRRGVCIQLEGPHIPSAPVPAESVDGTPDGSNSNDEWQETSIADSTEAPETDQQHQNSPESEHSHA
jgi:UDP-GlcNAc:undecaprenyl-phosphate/decaprenyl-phosphate GlcNAc-1-phosphate transferase